MRVFKRVVSGLCVFGLSASLCGAAGVVPNTAGEAFAKAKPKLSKKKLTLTQGKSASISVKKAKKSSKYTWSMNKTGILKLANKKKKKCTITALRKGTVTLKCKVKTGKKKKVLKCKVTVKVKRAVTSIVQAYSSIFTNIGTCASYGSSSAGQLQTAKIVNHIKQHYNSFTLENEMKPEGILGNAASTLTVDEAKAKGYYIPEGFTESKVPELNFTKVDGAMKVASDNGLRMRGHTLVWHSQTPSWFFNADFKASGKTVTTEVMDKRLDFYVHNVMGHVMDKEKELKGSAGSIIYAWDVVNEYLHRPAGTNGVWESVYGNGKGSPTYVKKAFELAYDMLKKYEATDKVTLFYNDYNTYFEVQDVIDLVNFINKDEPAKICGGIGMQSHVDVKVPTIAQYATALDKFLATGLEVQITELDMTINFDTNTSYSYAPENETDLTQEKYVKEFMETIITKQKNRDKTVSPKGITGLTLWGMYDAVSWRGSCEPLLFGSSISDPKLSYYAFMDAASVWNS